MRARGVVCELLFEPRREAGAGRRDFTGKQDGGEEQGGGEHFHGGVAGGGGTAWGVTEKHLCASPFKSSKLRDGGDSLSSRSFHIPKLYDQSSLLALIGKLNADM